jgi:NADH-quinone oxidoreductase subunit K
MIVPLNHVLILAALIFTMGMFCLLVWRRNIIMMLIGIEIMLNAVILAFVGGAAHWGVADGQVFSIFIIAMTSAEVSLALALVVYLHRRKKSVNSDDYNTLQE